MKLRKSKAVALCGLVAVCICAVVAAIWLVGGRADAGRDGAAKGDETKSGTMKVVSDEHLQTCLAGAFPDALSDDAGSDGLAGITDVVFPMLASEHGEDCGDLSEVRSIEGIQYLTGLRNLDLGSMPEVNSGAPIADLTGLQQLSISQTAIADIEFVSSLPELSQLALPASACDVSALAGHDALQSVSIGCASADIGPLDGMGIQLVVPTDFDPAKAEASAATGNTVTVMNDDGSFDVYQLINGGVTVSHV